MSPTLTDAYPLVAAGLQSLTAYVRMTPDERSAYLQTAEADALATLFLEAGDLFLCLTDRVYKDIDRAVRDRWLSQGDDRFEKAVRGHARESGVTRQSLACIMPQVGATMPSAQWIKQVKHA